VAVLLGLALLDGICALAARPLARAATVAVTSTAGVLREGNALSNACFSVLYMAGPVLGGVLVAAGGASAALLANTGLFVAISLDLATARELPPAGSERAPTAGRVRAALAYVRRQPAIRVLLSVQATAVLFFTMTIPVEIVYAERSLHAGARGYGILLSAWGAGAVVGSAVYARWRRLPGRELIALGCLALGSGFLVMASAPALGLAIAGAVVAGAGNGIESVAAKTTLQEAIEQGWMALVMSFTESLYQAVPGAGIVLGGAIAALAGPRVALASAGCGAVAITAVVWIVLRPSVARRRRGLEPAPPEGLGPGR
jgi:MFS family permease